ncbi:S-layer homology domain-containing protein [Paenibacillus sp. JX-17]|uniref:S-layer homology domain-containing protein n=1 Tax=Paenibacillus lacisoli TaxID=3064525 RepID=A0ABT9CGX9_9BACL|nr:S-layer homology domain-containing protein [Paenibacillus sp. JX-17]MDO7908538.1 S-layer homology domain-containing protein [Paenibacillus sp. JX-17]
MIIKYQRLVSLLLVFVLAMPLFSSKARADMINPPVPGNQGEITASYIDNATLQLNWNSAVDGEFDSSTLEYQVYQSDNDKIAALEDSYLVTPLNNWQQELYSINVSDLEAGQTYYFNVVVKNNPGQAAIYHMLKVTFDPSLGLFNQAIKSFRGQHDSSLSEVLGALNDLQLNTPYFTDLSEDQKLSIAELVARFAPNNSMYKTRAQVQFITDTALQGILVFKSSNKLQALLPFYQQLSRVGEYFDEDDEDTLEIEAAAQKFINGTPADQALIAYLADYFEAMMDNRLTDKIGMIIEVPALLPSINSAADSEEMAQSLLMLAMFQMEINGDPNPGSTVLDPFPLDFSKMTDIANNTEKLEQLAQWMLDKKPSAGYITIQSIQNAFDGFFNRDKDSAPAPNPTPAPSTGSGSGPSAPSGTVPAPTTKQEQISVEVNGKNGLSLAHTSITRTTESNGVVKDLVTMPESIAKESVEKAKQSGLDTVQIVIPDTNDNVAETKIELPQAAVKQLNDSTMRLEIATANAVITIPTKSIAGFDQDLYFRVVPIKAESDRKAVEDRAKKEKVIQQVSTNSNVQVLSRPVEIETNMQNHEVTLALPLRDSLPTDAAARQQTLDNLAVYIEHSDGTKELIPGQLTKLPNGSEALEFTVNKFSTFTLVTVDGLKEFNNKAASKPYIQGFGTRFLPDSPITRAQMAAMLSRNLGDQTTAVGSHNFADVAAAHWAYGDIMKTQTAGIMTGVNINQFVPEGAITRSQMAMIAYRWMRQPAAHTSGSNPVTFIDVPSDSWAAEAISYVKSIGLMQGYNDNTFRPEEKLTRAEAVKVLNLLFKRPMKDATKATFSDVPASHWAYADIEAAAR